MLVLVLLFFGPSLCFSQPSPPPQPETGPGGYHYPHATVKKYGPYWAKGHCGTDCEYALGEGIIEVYMGEWSDGREVRPMVWVENPLWNFETKCKDPRPGSWGILSPEDFVQVAQEGFGDQQNSAAWSMQWWREKLYVGTVRSWICWGRAALHDIFPFLPYPPRDPDRDFDCTENPLDLPVQAEIWCYTPETETWERVYQSPKDTPIPKDPAKLVARDVGFRGMTVFTEPDGTEALYVLGVNSRAWTGTEDEEVPCPRILRTTDGVNFEAIPPDPALPPCVEGYDGDVAGYRSTAIYKGRLFITVGTSGGSGVLLESDNPSAGKDSFRPVTPDGMLVWEVIPFNGYLYVGTIDIKEGYGIYKTTAEGEPPYEFIPVVTQGGYLPKHPSMAVVSMFVFKNRLYAGTDKPVELIRINPDDTWDLIVGKPRATPDGMKVPLSGFDSGFDWPLNRHLWRMQEHEGVLYAGTFDQSTWLRNFPIIGKLVERKMGFDLYASLDGIHWTPITTNAFGDKFQWGLRTFASTPHGLFFGTYNFGGGLQIWKGTKEMADDSLGLGSPPTPAARLEAEKKHGAVVLSWSGKPDSRRFRIFRSTLKGASKVLPKKIAKKLPDMIMDEIRYELPSIREDLYVPGPFIEIASTDQFFYVDTNTKNDQKYHYYVVAEDATGEVSTPSNLVRVPSLAPVVTFYRVQNTINSLARRGKIKSLATKKRLVRALRKARNVLTKNDPKSALRILIRIRTGLAKNEALAPWHAEDLDILLSKLIRRVRLAKQGILSASDLD